MRNVNRSPLSIPAGLFGFFCALSALSVAQVAGPVANPAAGAGSVIVHSKFGGQIFGFDIDQKGTEGVLTEARTLPNGNVIAAIETFDQATGKILNVVSQTNGQDDFITLGVVGNSVGLVEHEHEVSFLNLQRTFNLISPLSSNKVTGSWKPPLGAGFLINAISRNQGGANNAVLATGTNFNPVVFSTNIAANKFGTQFSLTNEDFTIGVPPAFGYDTATNQAVVSQDFGGVLDVPEVGLVNLATGASTTFPGVGFGFVNGLAVDAADGIVATTTEIDFSVEFYDLSNLSGFTTFLPDADNQIFSGGDIEYDSINKLFLVAQPVSSTGSSGSSIQVFTPQGVFVESINGLNFSNAGNIVPAHIALKPSNRTGFIDGPSAGVTQLQSFTY